MNQSFENSFAIFDSAIRHLLSHYTLTNDLYQDLYQDCYCAILDVLKHHTYDPVMNLYGYAYSISRNQVTKFFYHHKKLVTLSNEESLGIFTAIPDTNIHFEEDLSLTNLAEIVLDRFNKLFGTNMSTDDLIKLINTPDKDISQQKLILLKGDFLWTVAKNK